MKIPAYCISRAILRLECAEFFRLNLGSRADCHSVRVQLPTWYCPGHDSLTNVVTFELYNIVPTSTGGYKISPVDDPYVCPELLSDRVRPIDTSCSCECHFCFSNGVVGAVLLYE